MIPGVVRGFLSFGGNDLLKFDLGPNNMISGLTESKKRKHNKTNQTKRGNKFMQGNDIRLSFPTCGRAAYWGRNNIITCLFSSITDAALLLLLPPTCAPCVAWMPHHTETAYWFKQHNCGGLGGGVIMGSDRFSFFWDNVRDVWEVLLGFFYLSHILCPRTRGGQGGVHSLHTMRICRRTVVCSSFRMWPEKRTRGWIRSFGRWWQIWMTAPDGPIWFGSVTASNKRIKCGRCCQAW